MKPTLSRRPLRTALLLCVIALGAVAFLWWRGLPSTVAIDSRQARLLAANPAAQAAYTQGETASETGSVANAALGFRTASRLEPRSALALLNLGRMEARLGHQQEAIAALEGATRLEPNWGPPWSQLASAYADANDLGKAEQAAAQACSLAPRSVEALLLRSHVASLKGDHASAEQYARQAARISPQAVEPWLGLGDALLAAPGAARTADAVLAFQTAVQRQRNPYALRRLGEAQLRAGQAAPAVETLREAARLAPTDASAAYQLAQALQAAGQASEAAEWNRRARRLQEQRYQLTTLERRVQQSPGDAALLAKLAAQHALLGHRQEAIEAYQKALLLEPESPQYRRALAALESGTDGSPQ